MVPVPIYAQPTPIAPLYTQNMNNAPTPMMSQQSYSMPNINDDRLFKTVQRTRAPTAEGAKEHERSSTNTFDHNALAFAANGLAGAYSSPSFAINAPLLHVVDASPTICVVGCGFVGESLLRTFSKSYPTIGYDISVPRIDQLKSLLTSNRTPSEYPLILTTTPATLRSATHVLVSVPTLLKSNHTCDTSYVRTAIQAILQHVRPGTTIVIESSVGVGTTRQLLGLHRHRYHCGMSPERVDPGRTTPVPRSVPKIISGLTLTARDRIADLYRSAYDHVVPVSSCEIAEMTKLHENCFRMVNIAYANEVADACHALRLDPNEVIEAASTKPYGFMPFYPGLGVGGHCIPVNTHYLMQSRKPGQFPVLERATKAMSKRPDKLAKTFWRKIMLDIGARERRASGLQQQEVDALQQLARPVSFASASGSLLTTTTLPRILVVGLGFKRGESVLDFSPSVAFAQVLKDIGCSRLAFYDRLVSEDKIARKASWLEKLEAEEWTGPKLSDSFDGVAVCVNQKDVDWNVLDEAEKAGLLVRRFVSS